MNNKVKYLIGLAVVAIVIVITPLHHVIAIISVKDNRPVAYFRIEPGEEFIIEFVHSVNKRPVYDYHTIDSGQIVITKSRYDSFGAGMPEYPPEGMQLAADRDGMLELSGINRRMDYITVFVGTVAQHQLHFKQSKIFLADFVPPGQQLQFRVMKISLLQMWGGGCLQ